MANITFGWLLPQGTLGSLVKKCLNVVLNGVMDRCPKRGGPKAILAHPNLARNRFFKAIPLWKNPSMLEHLPSPPIVEALCGVVFKPIEGFDPFHVLEFRSTHLPEFPKEEMKQGLAPGTDGTESKTLGFQPNVWLLADDGQQLIQVQKDRLHFNWRRRTPADTAPYPRFSDHDGSPGVLSLFLRTWSLFCGFCEGRYGVNPVPETLQIAKIDHLYEGEHWTDREDLLRCLPTIRTFTDLHRQTEEMDRFAIEFVEVLEGGSVNVAIRSALYHPDPTEKKKLVRLETSFAGTAKDPASIAQQFMDANVELNGLFERLISKEQRDMRFCSQPSARIGSAK